MTPRCDFHDWQTAAVHPSEGRELVCRRCGQESYEFEDVS